MKLAHLTPSSLRLTLAGFTAGAGGIVSIAMVFLGGPMARYLPTGEGFHLAAVVGAGLAGLACASGFGHLGKRGWVFAAFMAIAVTLAGAIIGSTLMGLAAGTVMGGTLGLIAILNAFDSWMVVLVWGLTMAALHIAARRARLRPAINP